MTTIDKFIIARWMYSIGEPIMSDAEYTLLQKAAEREYPDSPYHTRSWSSDPCPVELLKAYGYSDSIRDIVLSDKSESIQSINDWYVLKSLYQDLNEPTTLSYKHDGWNIQVSYYNGELVQIQTRGRASDALSASALRSKVPSSINLMGKKTICCEATVSFSNYKIVKEKIESRSQRGAVVSCLSRPEMVRYIDLHAFSIIGDEQVLNPFEVLKENGFTTVPYVVINNWTDMQKQLHKMSEEVAAYDWPTDGVVIRNKSTRAIRLLAWEEPIYKSYVTGYEESYGPYRIAVKAKIRPIVMKNSTQRVVSVTNYQNVIDNNLRVGYPIAYKLTSMAIATLDAESTRLLQKEWEGREEEFRSLTDENEKVKSTGTSIHVV